jgi:hypothetical protein
MVDGERFAIVDFNDWPLSGTRPGRPRHRPPRPEATEPPSHRLGTFVIWYLFVCRFGEFVYPPASLTKEGENFLGP